MKKLLLPIVCLSLVCGCALIKSRLYFCFDRLDITLHKHIHNCFKVLHDDFLSYDFVFFNHPPQGQIF